MRTAKRLLAFFLSLPVLFLCVFPGAFAEGDGLTLPLLALESSGTTGDCSWSLSGNKLTISGSGKTADYTADVPAPWGANA